MFFNKPFFEGFFLQFFIKGSLCNKAEISHVY